LAGEAPLEEAVRRNVTLTEGFGPEPLAERLRLLATRLGGAATDEVLAGRIAR
jgi:hypothetical protein